MAFKIKDGVRIGTTDIFDNAGTLLVNAPTATKWLNARTITLGGDLSGSVSVDGSQNVTLTATIAADSVALGTDTTGNYVSLVQSSGTGIVVSGTAGENATFSVAHADTSTQATVTNSGRTYLQSITLDDFGHITAVTSATEPTEGSGTLTLNIGSAGATGSSVTIATGTGFNANSSSNVTYSVSVGPALSGLATTMTGAGSGFLKKTAADTYTIDTNTYLTAESDTLATVTGRGATTSTALSLTNSTASSNTTTGALVVTGGVGIGGALNVGGNTGVTGNLTITGNLIVNGTTTTVNSTTTTLDDPIITLGGDSAPGSDDNKDRGVEFRWHNGTSAKIGFFGYDDSTGKFTFIPDATNSSEVFSGTTGEIDAKIDWSNILNTPAAATVNNGTLTLTASAGATNTSVTIGTGTGFSANDSNNETYDIDVGPALSNLATTMTGAGSGFLKKTAQDTYTVDTNTYLTTESDTLSSVTARGNTTTDIIIAANTTQSTSSLTGAIVVGGGLGVAKNITTKASVALHNSSDTKISEDSGLSATVATTTITDLDTWAVATYRSARYLVQITQGSNYQVSEVLVLHNGTTTTMTEYAVLESNGALGTLTSDISAGNARLRVTMGTSTSATVKIHRTLVTV
jgi:hypothetical protein